jgi:penicillin amidase
LGENSWKFQGALAVDDGRQLSFAPSWRFITDMSSNVFYSILPGGPSGSRFSGLYNTEIDRWLKVQYKTITAKS